MAYGQFGSRDAALDAYGAQMARVNPGQTFDPTRVTDANLGNWAMTTSPGGTPGSAGGVVANPGAAAPRQDSPAPSYSPAAATPAAAPAPAAMPTSADPLAGGGGGGGAVADTAAKGAPGNDALGGIMSAVDGSGDFKYLGAQSNQLRPLGQRLGVQDSMALAGLQRRVY
jgi:hypothetical protein